MATLFSMIWGWVQAGITWVVNLLPNSPFQIELPESVANILGYINYFVPIGKMVKVLSAWTLCIATWYLVSIVARWVKAIE